ncbi:MAG: hypothetical protein JNM70_13835 [Anaerolineae bacterium]|nr:hypothetical protein [Anaerolineae bacterium]
MARILLKIALVVLLTVGPWYAIRFVAPSFPGVQAKIDSLIEQRTTYMEQNTADPAVHFPGKEWVEGLRQVMTIVLLGAILVTVGAFALSTSYRTSNKAVQMETAAMREAQDRLNAAQQDLQRLYQNQAVDSRNENRRIG